MFEPFLVDCLNSATQMPDDSSIVLVTSASSKQKSLLGEILLESLQFTQAQIVDPGEMILYQ